MFIAFEGVEGSGKSTQAKLLSKWLDEQNIGHVLTKEPGSILSKECQQIRKLLLSPENSLDERAEMFLYLADRAQHVGNCIWPALLEGKWVISDRFSFSTYSYQGYGRDQLYIGQSDWFRLALNIAAHNCEPKVSFIMDLPVEIGLERAISSNVEFKGGDRMEQETIEFHQKIRDGFLKIAEDYSHRCVVLDATKSIEELHKEVKEVVAKL